MRLILILLLSSAFGRPSSEQLDVGVEQKDMMIEAVESSEEGKEKYNSAVENIGTSVSSTMKMSVLWLILILALLALSRFQCENNQVGSCFCHQTQTVQYEIFCPSLVDSKVHIKFVPNEYFQLTCQR